MIKDIILLYWRLCLLKTSPEQMPEHPLWISFLVWCYLLFSAVVLTAFDQKSDFSGYFFTRCIMLLIYTLQLWFVMRFKGYTSRFAKTLSALMGKEIIFTAIVLVFVAIGHFDQLKDHSLIASLVSLLFLFLYAWNILVEGFIFSRSLAFGLFLGISLAVTLFIINEWVEMKWIFPLMQNMMTDII